MPTPHHHRARVIGTVGAFGAHAYLAVLGATNLLNFTVPTRYALIDQVASEPFWTWAHGLMALLLLTALRWPYSRRRPDAMPYSALVCSIAFALMASWGFFHMLWGLSAIRPVSLAAPGLALVVAAGEHLLANAWARGSYTKAG